MKCILHIGTEKTGSTSLQEFLHRNRVLLRNCGFLFPHVVGVKNHQTLSIAAYNAARCDDRTRDYGLHTQDDFTAFRNKTISKLKSEIECSEAIHTVIFSSEFFQSRLTTLEEISRLRDILHRLACTDISVVVYLRNPVELANSLYSTAIKAGDTAMHPPGPDHPYWRQICDHQSTLKQFSAVFGNDAVKPRIYSKTDLVGGSIISDFAACIGLTFGPGAYEIPVPQNTALTVLGLELLRRINQRIPKFIDGQQNPLRGNLVDFVSKHFCDGSKYGMPEAVQQKYMQAFSDSNEWVRVTYFPERSSLFPEAQIHQSGALQCDPSDLDQIAEALASLWEEKSVTAIDLEESKLHGLKKILRNLQHYISLRHFRL